MSTVAGLKFSPKHTWVKVEGEFAYVGVSDFAQEQLGEVLFVEMPEVGDEFAKGDTFANIESVKAASEIYMPISGKIVEINEALVDAPEQLNEDCYEGGWLVKVESSTAEDELKDLVSYADYKEELE